MAAACNSPVAARKSERRFPPRMLRVPGLPTSNPLPTLAELDVQEKSPDMDRRTPSRTQSRTFPQSNNEKENNRNLPNLSSIDARLSSREIQDTEDEHTGRYAGIRPRRLQPVPEDFQEADNQPQADNYDRKKLHQRRKFDTQLKELQAAMRKEQGGKQTALQERRFAEIWESKLLPTIEEVLDDHVEGEYTVNVARSSEPGKRIIVIMTRVLLTGNVERQIKAAKSEILPGDLDSTTTVMFRQGKVEVLTNPEASLSRVSSISSEDSCISPRNTDWYENPAIGDSVGWNGESASLGPLLQINKTFYRLVCWHLFDDRGENRYCVGAEPPRGLSTVHPSMTDSGNRLGTRIGDVVAYSGLMYETLRRSVCMSQDPAAYVVTDWALVESPEAIQRRVNTVRRPTLEGDDNVEIEITTSKDPDSFRQACQDSQTPALVYSVGRTSGYTMGQLGITYGRHKLPDGSKTKNYIVDNATPHSETAVREWIRAGMGLPGDSGAGVFGFWDNELLGQIWARNAYEKKNTEPRIVFFTAMDDIYADIAERMPAAATSPVQLPTRQSIKDSVSIDERYLLDPISEVLDDADLEDDGFDQDQDQDQKMPRHRSAATSTSRRLGAVVTLSKRQSLFEPPGCQPFQKWAKVIIHAATF
ncbi:hypothetical protein F5Y10DRAFT_281019 [Nemania abortiva]|nr:hypothetical protein F5Y10DRAFT_281019 [Nemania abortiva]